MDELIEKYEKNKKEIKQKLKIFSQTRHKDDRSLFRELCFCLLTPQSKALNCDKALDKLCLNKALYSRDKKRISRALKGLVRFHNNKASYICGAHKKLSKKGEIKLSGLLNQFKGIKLREWLVKNIKGLGYKESSHFMRNIGLGGDIAIIDRHILKNLKEYGVINEMPKSISGKKYLELEDKMREFSLQAKIPLDALDLLFWSNKTGYIFK